MTEENPESYEEAVHYGGGSEPDYSEEMARDEFLAEQNAKNEYEATQEGNAMADQEAREQEQQAKTEEEELNRIKIVLLALWDKSPHPEAQDIIKKYRDEIAREEK